MTKELNKEGMNEQRRKKKATMTRSNNRDKKNR